MSTSYILRFDDISPGMSWSKFLPLKEELEKLGVRVVLGVIPDCRDSSLQYEAERDNYFDWVRQWKTFGDTIAQHGTFHVYDTNNAGLLGINKRSEFAGRPLDEQIALLSHGKSILENEEVWQPYFMAPAHSFDDQTVDALNYHKFVGVTDGYGFYPYRYRGLVFVPQLTSVPIRPGFGICTICVHVNSLSEEAIRRLISFVHFHRGNFISFEEALTVKCPVPLVSSITRSVSRRTLRLVRALKKMVN